MECARAGFRRQLDLDIPVMAAMAPQRHFKLPSRHPPARGECAERQTNRNERNGRVWIPGFVFQDRASLSAAVGLIMHFSISASPAFTNSCAAVSVRSTLPNPDLRASSPGSAQPR